VDWSGSTRARRISLRVADAGGEVMGEPGRHVVYAPLNKARVEIDNRAYSLAEDRALRVRNGRHRDMESVRGLRCRLTRNRDAHIQVPSEASFGHRMLGGGRCNLIGNTAISDCRIARVAAPREARRQPPRTPP
jgi:hypothetical protein